MHVASLVDGPEGTGRWLEIGTGCRRVRLRSHAERGNERVQGAWEREEERRVETRGPLSVGREKRDSVGIVKTKPLVPTLLRGNVKTITRLALLPIGWVILRNW